MTDEESPPAGRETRLRLSWGGATHPGQVRPVNQDALFADRGLFVVADGMGGHQAGEVAARISVKTVAGGEHGSVDELVAGVVAANAAVWEQASTSPEYKGMGTTLTALAVVGDGRPPVLGLVNVGDSRVYRLREGTLEQLTEDHSYVAELVRRGQISEDAAETHPYRNMLTRAIGVADTVDVDRWDMNPQADDLFLLCSDGLVNELSDEEILELLVANDDPTEMAENLIAAANQAGGRDNITVVIVKIDVEDAVDEASAHDRDVVSPLETGVIAPIPGGPAQTVDLEDLSAQISDSQEHLAETTEALATLEVIEDELDEAPAGFDPDTEASDTEASESTDESSVIPPQRPHDGLAAFDLPKLDGDDTTLPWLIDDTPQEPAPTSPPEEQPPVADVSQPDASESGASELVEAESAAAEPEVSESKVIAPDVAEDDANHPPAVAEQAQAAMTEVGFVVSSASEEWKPPLTVSDPVDHFAPALRGWRAPVAVTWRSLLFVSVVVVVVIAAGVLVGWYARSAYYVGYAGDEVVIYQGRPDGVLWFDPTLEEGTGLFRQDLSESISAQIEGLFETATLEGARAFIAEVRIAVGVGAQPAVGEPIDESDRSP